MGGVIGSLGHAGDTPNGISRPESVEPTEGQAGQRRVKEKHVPNSMPSSFNGYSLMKIGFAALALQNAALVKASQNAQNTVHCNNVQKNEFTNQLYQDNRQCMMDLSQNKYDLGVYKTNYENCQTKYKEESFKVFKSMDQTAIFEQCSQTVKQDKEAEGVICEQQVDLNNELEQTQYQYQEQVANLTAQIEQLQEQYQEQHQKQIANLTTQIELLQEQYQEQVANLTARIELLQKQNQEMKNKQTTVQLTVAQASAAAAAIGLPMLGVGAGIAKLCCSGKSKDKKETGEPDQSTQPDQVPQYSEDYTAIPMEVVSVEVCEDDHRSDERRRLHG